MSDDDRMAVSSAASEYAKTTPAGRAWALRYAAERLAKERTENVFLEGESAEFLLGAEWAVRTLGELSREEEGESGE